MNFGAQTASNSTAIVIVLSTHLTDCLYRVSFRRYRQLKLPLGSEVIQKMVFGRRFVAEGVSHISDMRLQTILTFDHVDDFR